MTTHTSPDHILKVGFGFFGAKALLSAVELGLFTTLGDEALTGAEVERALAFHPRATADFLDALVALSLLERDGDGAAARYANTRDTRRFLVRGSPDYVGGILEMANARLYRFWADLTPALRSGQPQNEVRHSGRPMFEGLYADPARLEQFMHAMSGISAANFRAFAAKFDFSPYRRLADIGGATGQLSCIVAEKHPHLTCGSYDLPVVQPIAARSIAASGLADRVAAHPLDFFADDFPRGRHHHHGDDPPRLEPREEETADPQGL